MKSFTLPIVKAKDLKSALGVVQDRYIKYVEAVDRTLLEIKVVPNPKGTFSHPNRINR